MKQIGDNMIKCTKEKYDYSCSRLEGHGGSCNWIKNDWVQIAKAHIAMHGSVSAEEVRELNEPYKEAILNALEISPKAEKSKTGHASGYDFDDWSEVRLYGSEGGDWRYMVKVSKGHAEAFADEINKMIKEGQANFTPHEVSINGKDMFGHPQEDEKRVDWFGMLVEDKAEKGQYVHDVICNGNRNHPIDTPGEMCNCKNYPLFKRIREQAVALESTKTVELTEVERLEIVLDYLRGVTPLRHPDAAMYGLSDLIRFVSWFRNAKGREAR